MNSISSQPEIDVVEVFKQSWEIFRNNIGILVGAFVLVTAIVIVSILVSGSLAYLTCMALFGPLMLGSVAIVMGLLRKESVEFGVLFSGFQRFLPALMATLLLSVFGVIGTVFCIIPGIIVNFLYMFTFFYMYNQELDFWPSMEASRKVVMGNPVQWLVFSLTFGAFNLIGGIITCGLGLLGTIPMTLVAFGLAYQQIEKVPR